jgi:hypothetical protein
MSEPRQRSIHFRVIEQGTCKIFVLNNAAHNQTNSPSGENGNEELLSIYNKMREIASKRARISYLRREIDFLQKRVSAMTLC